MYSLNQFVCHPPFVNELSYYLIQHVFADSFIFWLKIVHWRNHLKFPEETPLTFEAKDLICRLLCDVDHRLGSAGAQQIKVYDLPCEVNSFYFL